MRVNLFLVFIMPIAFVLSACEKPEPDTAANTVNAFIDSAPKTFDPIHATDAISQNLQSLTHLSLIRIDRELKPEQAMAEKFRVDGAKKFYFKLKSDMRFHDGTRVGIQSVKASLLRFQDPKNKSAHREVFAGINIKASDLSGFDFMFETKEVEPFLLWDLALLKIHKVEDGQIIGTGPYRITRADHGLIELQKTQNGGEYQIGKIQFKVVSEDTSRYQLLMRGDLNATLNALSLSALHKLEKDANEYSSKFQIVNSPGINVSYLAFNFKNKILQNVLVRQALAYAINYDAILKERFGPFGFRSTGLLSYLHADYEKNVTRYGYDPQKSETLLDQAGYPRDRDGKRFRLEFKSTSEKSALELVRIVADDFRKIGIEASIRTTEFGTFLSDINNGSFDVFMSRWIGISNPSIYYRVFHSSGSLNRGGYHDKEMDELLNQAQHEPRQKKRKTLFSKIQKIAAVDLPYIPLWNWNNTFIGAKEFQTPVLYPNGNYLMYAELKRSPKK